MIRPVRCAGKSGWTSRNGPHAHLLEVGLAEARFAEDFAHRRFLKLHAKRTGHEALDNIPRSLERPGRRNGDISRVNCLPWPPLSALRVGVFRKSASEARLNERLSNAARDRLQINK